MLLKTDTMALRESEVQKAAILIALSSNTMSQYAIFRGRLSYIFIFFDQVG